MSRVCRICLQDSGEADYHPRCLRTLFGTTRVPIIDIETSKLHTAALAMVGHTSLSGIQKKISVKLSVVNRATLQVAAEGGRYVLKPQTGTYPALPENEHLTMQLAKLSDIEVAPNGLINLSDGALAYIVRRFDRLSEGQKLRQEDFCQLASLSPKEKYDGSAELTVRLLRKYAKEPLVEISKLYRQHVFSWWAGNGDMHLKNFSLFTGENGITRLTPAYDLVCTRLIIPNDPLALPVQGRNDKLHREEWMRFAAYCELPEKSAHHVLEKQASVMDDAIKLIDQSFLPNDQKDAYKYLIDERTQKLKQ